MSTSSLAFGSVAVGQTSNAAVTVRNSGSSAVEITQVQVSGQDFSVSGQPSQPVSVAGGSNYNLNVQFAPKAAQTETGTVIVNSPGGSLTVALSGTGVVTAGGLSGVTCSTGSISGAGTDACTVMLTGPASAGGLTVGLSSSNTAVVVPGSVTVPAGASSAGFTARISAVTTAQAAVLSATAGGVTQNYAIQLGAASPALTLSAASLNFGSVAVNTPATPQSVTLTSSGTGALTISGALVTGAGFSLTGGSFPVTLQPGQAVQLTVGFDPSAIGAVSGAVTLTTNTAAGTATIALSGTGQAPGALSGLTCSTGTITGAGTDACRVVLTGPAGSGGLTVGLSSSNTAVVVPGSVTVPAGASSAWFTATISGVTTAQTAVLAAAAGGVTENYTVQLGAASPGLTLQSTTLSFGNVSLNTPTTQSVTLTSSGTAAVTISGASVSGAGFSLAGLSFPVTLQPGQTATLVVQFDPSTTGAVTGAVTLTSNSSTGTATITLSGTGQTGSEVDLTWNPPTDSADPVAGYDVYRAISGSSSYQLLNASAETATSFADTAVQSGVTYSYYVVSVDASGNQSGPSNLFTVSIP